MIEFDLGSICEIQRRLDYNYNHGKDGKFISAKGAGWQSSRTKTKKKQKKSLRITDKERAKVAHDINKVYHKVYEGKEICAIRTRSNGSDSPFYRYYFINNGFNEYDIYFKEHYDSHR